MDAVNAFDAWLSAFAWPYALLAIPLPLLVRWLLPRRRSAAAALRVPYGAHIDKIAAAGSGHALRGRGAGLLAWLAWIALCFACARPQQLGEPIAPPQVGRDLMLAVDLSGSMSEEDMELGGQVVDRLTAAKAVLADFLDRRGGDRVGLLVFGQRAYTLTPLTLDLTTVRQQLQDSVVGLAGRETALGDALALAVKRLQSQPSDQRVVILLTDGVNTAGVLDPAKAADLARDAKVRVHTIAFGGEGGVSLFGFRLPGGGDAEIDESGLQQIAQVTGGRFFRARDTESLAGIYAEIDRLEPIRRPGQAVRPRIERYPLPLAIALGLAALGAVPLRRRA
ncbi:VWA domain-containing protein [Lysobacter sp. HX-5-24]|uniref:VWA domain-containing protein n=1 Tax=Noviluteimonas gilva TaxID=2682097 RepID=A0A7C9HT96_9GAMM|nr:VWA domain-containing protein [Lysobacter gilvus]